MTYILQERHQQYFTGKAEPSARLQSLVEHIWPCKRRSYRLALATLVFRAPLELAAGTAGEGGEEQLPPASPLLVSLQVSSCPPATGRQSGAAAWVIFWRALSSLWSGLEGAGARVARGRWAGCWGRGGTGLGTLAPAASRPPLASLQKSPERGFAL